MSLKSNNKKKKATIGCLNIIIGMTGVAIIVIIIVMISVFRPTKQINDEINPAIKQNEDLSSSNTNNDHKEWYSGGTLHKASALDWQEASYANKLATCADMIAKLNLQQKLIREIGRNLLTTDDIKPYAEKLVECIDGATEKSSDPEVQNVYAGQSVATVATICMLTMGWVSK